MTKKALQEKIERYAKLKILGLSSELIDNVINRELILQLTKSK